MKKENKLQRFLDAQDTDFPLALPEVENGRKQSHWMWYIFPQIQGLGYRVLPSFMPLRICRKPRRILIIRYKEVD